MSRKMLIDATHQEETRVAIVHAGKIEEFDFESASKKPLRGNIYLARVTRVEPSLQAAFVEYGGNRHGFLPFNEIHPDYYQIPFADRQAILAEYNALTAEVAASHDDEEDDAPVDEQYEAPSRQSRYHKNDDDEEGSSVEEVETSTERPTDAGGDDDAEDRALERARRAMQRKYKIQEVIKRRQILLIQVVKEERGNKGAALTTYLSLAGRYSVLMPNTARGGGVSRKIVQGADRKRLKSVIAELDVPSGMGMIIRTAGSKRTKQEIKRDYDYLRRLWTNIRDTTLKSVAPCLIHEEGDLVKRAIRDLYDKDIEDVLVAGDEAYRQAKDFMKLLMPSHAKKVQHYREATPLFLRHRVEEQLEATFQSTVTLPSGGYLVINQTEALVAVDVNSGRATRERSVESTALKTNLEAADEICRQMRLRDLAGLIVIDFIDMDESRNNRAVEKRMRDALERDRARIQMGRISSFGLMELSRQRRRSSVLEGSHSTCPTCHGHGMLRSVGSSALQVLRLIEEEALKGRASALELRVALPIALYLLNEKRNVLRSIEDRYHVEVMVSPDDSLVPPDCVIERLRNRDADAPPIVMQLEEVRSVEDDDDEITEEDEDEDDGEVAQIASEPENNRSGARESNNRRKRRRGGRSRTNRDTDTRSEAAIIENEGTADDEAVEEASERVEAEATDEDGQTKRRRRRGRRGGRGRRGRGDAPGGENGAEAEEVYFDADAETVFADQAALDEPEAQQTEAVVEAVEGEAGVELIREEAPKPPRRRSRAKAKPADTAQPSPDDGGDEALVDPADEAPTEPRTRRRRKSETALGEVTNEISHKPEADAPSPLPVEAEQIVDGPAAEPLSDDEPQAAPQPQPAAVSEPRPEPDEGLRQRWRDRLKFWS
jgi:ribonuclease E